MQIDIFMSFLEKFLKYCLVTSPIQNKENVSAVVTGLSIIMESGGDSDVSKFVSR